MRQKRHKHKHESYRIRSFGSCCGHWRETCRCGAKRDHIQGPHGGTYLPWGRMLRKPTEPKRRLTMLNKHALSVAEFASKEKSSYTLQAIQVTPKETYATDQYRLVRVSRGNAPKVGSFPARAGFQAVEITE